MRVSAMAALALTFALAVVSGGSACSSFGSASSSGEDTPDAPTPDGPFDDGALPPLDGGGDPGPFCPQHPSATICDDFDLNPLLDPRWQVGGSGGTSAISTTAFSPPRSYSLVSPVPGNAGDRCSKDLAYVRQDVSVVSGSFGFAASYYVDYAPGQDAVAGAQLRVEQAGNNDRCTFYTKWQNGIPKVSIDQILGGVPENNVNALPLKATAVAPRTWVRIELRFEVGAGGTVVKAGVDGAALVEVGIFPTCLGKELKQFQLATNCNTLDAAQPFSTLVDNVVLDVP